MIFCTKCGRYFSDGTISCGVCHADLREFGHASFQSAPIVVKAALNVPLSRPAPKAAVTFSENDPTTDRDSTTTDMNPVFNRDKFLLRQKALAIKEKYYVMDDQGSPLMFVERPALLTQQFIMLAAVAATFFGGTFLMSLITPFFGAGYAQVLSLVGVVIVFLATAFVFVLLVPKRHITFYKDDSKSEKLMEIKQLNKIEFPYANFSVLDTTGNLIGSLRKNVLFDYIRRRWQVNNASGTELCMAKEDSIILSLLRRTGIPIFLFLRTNFIFLAGERVIGEFNRKLTLLDRYVLDLTADAQRTFDRRIALALGVMLDTGERR